MKFLDREIKAAIFDLDGTVIDSTSIWGEIDKEFFSKRGLELPETYCKDIAHLGLIKTAEYTKKTFKLNDSIEEIIREWQDGAKDHYLNKIPLKDNAKEILEYFKNNNVKLAVATANSRDLYEPCLKRLEIYDYFEFFADVDSIGKDKTNSEFYKTVANMLGFEPHEIAVFDDISSALKTSFDSGFLTIAVFDNSSVSAEKEKRAFSNKFIYNFSELF